MFIPSNEKKLRVWIQPSERRQFRFLTVVYSFINGALNDAVSSSKYEVSNGGITELERMWKEEVVAWQTCFEEQRKPRGISDKTIVLQAETWTRHLPNTKELSVLSWVPCHDRSVAISWLETLLQLSLLYDPLLSCGTLMKCNGMWTRVIWLGSGVSGQIP
jgi:hypothetical protein